MSWCTASTIAYLIGYVPPPGATIVIPRSQIGHYSDHTKAEVRACAARFRINWKIDESK